MSRDNQLGCLRERFGSYPKSVGVPKNLSFIEWGEFLIFQNDALQLQQPAIGLQRCHKSVEPQFIMLNYRLLLPEQINYTLCY